MIVKVSGLIINLVLGYWLFISPVAAQTVYYVATTGNDSDPGSESQPWRTIQKAANTMVAGDMVTVMAGSFPERINITRSGSSELPITFQAQGTAITKGFKITASYITVKGFEIANTDYVRWDSGTSAGVYIHGAFNTIEHNYIHDATLGGLKLHGPPQDPTTTHHNSILNNRLYHNEMVGIDVNGRDNLIEGNEVWGTVQCHPALVAIEGPGCPNYSAVNGLDADGMRFFGQGHTFKKNNIHDIRISPPESVNPHIDCFQTWAGTNNELAQDILFEQNYCENLNQSMHAFMLAGGTNNLTIKNNIFKAYGGINTGGGADYLYVYNNVFANSLSYYQYAGAIGLESVAHAKIFNNIFYDQPYHTVTAIGDTSNIEIDYNLAYNSNGTTPHCIQWGNYDTCLPTPNHQLWQVDPQFVNPSSGNFHLKTGSPAINAGADLSLSGVNNDYDGVVRPQGSGFDIGAYEYLSTGNTYYVDSSNGSDSNSGTSESSPWQTLSKVNSLPFQPGDNILFKRGSSWTGPASTGSAALDITSPGNSTNPITFSAYGAGPLPVITTPGTDNRTRVVRVRADWIIIEYLKLENAHGGGVDLETGSDNNIVRNNEITNTGFGIGISGQFNQVNHDYIHDLHMFTNTPGGNDDVGAIGVSLNNASNNEVSYNRIIRAIAPSYDYNTDGGVVEWWANSDNNYVHHNWGEASNGFFEVGGRSGNHALNNVVAYNVSLNNRSFSHLHVGGTFAVDANFRVENNTIIETQSHDPTVWAMISFSGTPQPNSYILRNNLFLIDDVLFISPADSRGWVFTHENNLYQFLDFRNILGFSLNSGEKITDIRFKDYLNQDFHLLSSSPAINTGLDLSYTRDYDDQDVPYGPFPDIGAYEYVVKSPSTTPTPSPTPPPETDLDGDLDTDFLDLLRLILGFGAGGLADFNHTGLVDIFDFNLLIQNW